MGPSFQRVQDVERLIEAILQGEDRHEVLSLLMCLEAARLMGRSTLREITHIRAPKERLLNVEEAAALAGPSFTPKWFYTNHGKLRSTRRIGRRLMFYEPELHHDLKAL